MFQVKGGIFSAGCHTFISRVKNQTVTTSLVNDLTVEIFYRLALNMLALNDLLINIILLLMWHTAELF